MLAIALAIYLIEKIGQALLAISNVILLVALAWILTLMLRPVVNWIHGLTAARSVDPPAAPSLGDRAWPIGWCTPPTAFRSSSSICCC